MFAKILPLSLVLFAAGCAASTSEPVDSGEEGVTGVTDLAALEAELGLVKDTKDAQGNWSRPNAKLQAGPCYQQTVGSSPNFEFRRYSKGAAFFAKKGTAPATGDMRPVVCVDVDVTPWAGRKEETLLVSTLGLDMAMRYHLGKPLGAEGAAGHIYLDFERGAVQIGDAGHYCGLYGPDAHGSPPLDAGAAAFAACKQQTGDDQACYAPAFEACQEAYDVDVARDTLERPAYDGSYLYDVQGPNMYASGEIISFVHRFAMKSAASADAFTLSGDPVGRFVSAGPSDDGGSEHLRFEHLDAHHVRAFGSEILAITPKSSDANIADNAVVYCTRLASVGYDFNPLPYQCRGL